VTVIGRLDVFASSQTVYVLARPKLCRGEYRPSGEPISAGRDGRGTHTEDVFRNGVWQRRQYSADGLRLLSLTAADSSESFGYDDRGNEVHRSIRSFGQTFEIQHPGAVIEAPGLPSIHLVRDESDKITSVQADGQDLVRYVYDGVGRCKSMALGPDEPKYSLTFHALERGGHVVRLFDPAKHPIRTFVSTSAYGPRSALLVNLDLLEDTLGLPSDWRTSTKVKWNSTGSVASLSIGSNRAVDADTV